METNGSFGPADLKSHLGYWMRLVSSQVSSAFAARLEGEGVSVIEWLMLRELYEHALAPSILARRIGLTRGAITKLADRLTERHLLRREASASDGRGQTLALTMTGRSLVPRLAALADRNDQEFFGSLTPQDRATLERLLRDIAKGARLSGVLSP